MSRELAQGTPSAPAILCGSGIVVLPVLDRVTCSLSTQVEYLFAHEAALGHNPNQHRNGTASWPAPHPRLGGGRLEGGSKLPCVRLRSVPAQGWAQSQGDRAPQIGAAQPRGWH